MVCIYAEMLGLGTWSTPLLEENCVRENMCLYHAEIHVLAKIPTEIPETSLLLMCIFINTFSTSIQKRDFASLSCGV